MSGIVTQSGRGPGTPSGPPVRSITTIMNAAARGSAEHTPRPIPTSEDVSLLMFAIPQITDFLSALRQDSWAHGITRITASDGTSKAPNAWVQRARATAL